METTPATNSSAGTPSDGGVDPPLRLVMLPGIGADHRLFSPQLERFADVVVPDWIEPAWAKRFDAEPLSGYAGRFLEDLIQRDVIPRDRPWALVGFSFGAQVALELTLRLVEAQQDPADAGLDVGEPPPLPRGVLLVSACRDRHAVTGSFKRQVFFGSLPPVWMVRSILMLIVPRFAGKNGLDADRTADLASMAKSADVRMIRYAGRATVDWRWTRDSHERELTDAGVHLHHIHGEGDHTIPLVREHADEIVAGGHHLLTWTNPVEVNAAIERELLGRRKSNPCAAAPDAPVRTG